MDQIVSYQLQRATAPEISLSSKPVAVAPVALKLLRSLDKVYRDKSITANTQIEENCQFSGDERDLMELLGNLLDNAYKACRAAVSVSARIDNRDDHQLLTIAVEDDGAGIPETQRQAILNRGVRADTSQPGQGIGLAVTQEIVESYHGRLVIGESPLGGASFNVVLPGKSGL